VILERLVLSMGLAATGLVSASAQQFEFAASPHQGLNRVYRVDRVSGEVGACQFGLRDSGIGVTLCYPAGEGAKAGPAGEFGLLASNHTAEAGIFRINRRTGEVSICYVLNDEKVVCTPAAK